MVMPDKTIICKSIDRPLHEGCEVGGLLTVVRPTDDGSCTLPVKITGIADRAEIITIMPIGRPQRVQRRTFARVRVDNGVQMRLEFDSNNSRYKSMKVYDISGGGVGVTIYSKNPILSGQNVWMEIELYTLKSRIRVRGEVAHCSLRNPNEREYLLGIKFTEIDERDQRTIVEYVAAEQRKREEKEKREYPQEVSAEDTEEDADSSPEQVKRAS